RPWTRRLGKNLCTDIPAPGLFKEKGYKKIQPKQRPLLLQLKVAFGLSAHNILTPNNLIEKFMLLMAGGISSVIYICLKYVLRYRYRVIAKNLQSTFPEKGKKELGTLITNYYRHMADLCVEPILF